MNVSYEAFTDSGQCEQDRNRRADSLNGYIVNESEDEASSPDIPKAVSPIDPRLHNFILSRRFAIKRRARRNKAKKIAEASLLGCKKGGKLRGVLTKFPDIGNKIEEYVRNRNVGAD